MPVQYIPLLIFAVLAAAFPAVTLWLAKFFASLPLPKVPSWKPYESGNPHGGERAWALSGALLHHRDSFVIFDVETIFLFPWAVRFNQMGLYGLEAMLVFLGILIVGYVWLYRKGALNWPIDALQHRGAAPTMVKRGNGDDSESKRPEGGDWKVVPFPGKPAAADADAIESVSQPSHEIDAENKSKAEVPRPRRVPGSAPPRESASRPPPRSKTNSHLKCARDSATRFSKLQSIANRQ